MAAATAASRTTRAGTSTGTTGARTTAAATSGTAATWVGITAGVASTCAGTTTAATWIVRGINNDDIAIAVHNNRSIAGCVVAVCHILGSTYNAHGNDVALLCTDGEVLRFNERCQGKALVLRQVHIAVLSSNQAFVAQDDVEERGVAIVDVVEGNSVGDGQTHNWYGNLCLVCQRGNNLVFVLNFCFHNVPRNAHGLVGDGGKVRRCLAWAYHYVLTVTVVLLGSDVELINSLVKVFEEDTSGSVIRRIALNHRCTRIVVEHLDVRTLNVGLFAVLVAVDGILVLNLHTQGTLGLTHHLHIEIYGDAAAIFAVDGDVTFLEDVHSEVTRIEAQHHCGTVAVLHRGHVGRRNEAYKTIQSRRQRYADASRLALSAVGQRDGICAARALRNGRSDAVRICYEFRLVQSRVVVCLHRKHCSFVGVEDNSDAVPVLAAGHFHRREPVAHGVCGISRELRQRVHFEVVVLRIARQRGSDIVQGLCGEVADEEVSLIGFVLEHFVLDIAVADALHSIYVK